MRRLFEISMFTTLAFGLLAALPGLANAADCSNQAGVTVQVLGSGGPIADDARASTSYLVWQDGASRALIDAGGGAFLRFGEAGAKFTDLDFIGLSHFHADHSSDLPALLKSGWFARRTRPLTLAGPGPGGPFPGLGTYLNSLFARDSGAYGYLSGYLDGSDGFPQLLPVEVATGDPAAVDAIATAGVADLSVSALPVPHAIVPTLAFRLSIGGQEIVFASDQNGSNPAFTDFARGADLLVMHMVIPGDAEGVALKLHATPARIGEIARDAEAKQLLLSHFMARSLQDLDGNVRAVRESYQGPVLVAQDLACFEVGDRAD
jgi:ribonuclease BN (tRNA processing enzyme)